jgi:hypothetical protein
MVILSGRVTALFIFLVAGVLLSGGCTDEKKPTSEASPAVTLTPTSDLAPTSTGAGRGSLTGQELLWLQAVEQLLPQMNKAFDDVPDYTTAAALPAALRSLAYRARGCSRELDRLGSSPSARLQPVEALARKGCREYDKAARCIDQAAHLGTSSGSSQSQLQQQISCGMTAAEAGRQPLAEVQVKASEVRTATGSG